MLFLRKFAISATSCAAIAFSASAADAQSRYGHVPVAAPKYTPHNTYQGAPINRYSNRGSRYNQQAVRQGPKKYKNFFHKLRDQKHIAYQMPPPPGMFQQWVDYEPEYELTAGDQLDIVVSSAPELSRTLTVGPDGRVVMPMTRPIMAAGRTFFQVQHELMAELGKQLRDPTIAVTPRAYAPEQIYVGGQVGQPGTPNGGMMMRSVNIRGGLLNIREYNDNIQLRRGDIIFVPQSTIGEIGTFISALR